MHNTSNKGIIGCIFNDYLIIIVNWNVSHLHCKLCLYSIQGKINVKHFSIRWSKLKKIYTKYYVYSIIYNQTPWLFIKEMIRHLPYKNFQVKWPFPSEYFLLNIVVIKITGNVIYQYNIIWWHIRW